MKNLDQFIPELSAADHQNENIRRRREQLENAAEKVGKNVVARLSVAIVRAHAKEQSMASEEIDHVRLQGTHQTQEDLDEDHREGTEFGARMTMFTD